MKTIILRVPEALFEALKAHKRDTGTTVNEFVRRAVRMALADERVLRERVETREA